MSVPEEADSCPNADAIIAYATARGVQNPRLVYRGCFGWELQGNGRLNDPMMGRQTPAVWVVAAETKMEHGGGSADAIQINPLRFEPPPSKPRPRRSAR